MSLQAGSSGLTPVTALYIVLVGAGAELGVGCELAVSVAVSVPVGEVWEVALAVSFGLSSTGRSCTAARLNSRMHQGTISRDPEKLPSTA